MGDTEGFFLNVKVYFNNVLFSTIIGLANKTQLTLPNMQEALDSGASVQLF